MAASRKVIMGSGDVVDVPPEFASMYLGYPDATKEDLHANSLKEQYSSWLYAPTAAALGAVEGFVPGAISGVKNTLSAISPEVGQDFADVAAGSEAAHPYAHGAGFAGGLIAGIGVGTTEARVLGLGGKAALAVKAGLQSAGMTADDLAIKHVETPEGGEKVAAILGVSFLFGGVVGLAGSKVFSKLTSGAIGEAGAALEEKGSNLLNKNALVMNPGVQETLAEAAPEVQDGVKELIVKHGLADDKLSASTVKARLQSVISGAEADLRQAKAVSTEGLPMADQVAFSNELRPLVKGIQVKALGDEAAVYAPKNLGELHVLRQELESLTNHSDASSLASQKLLQAEKVVSGYMEKVLQKNAELHPEIAGDQLERWIAANADYSSAKTLQAALLEATKQGKSVLGRVGQKLASAGGTMAAFGGLAAFTGHGLGPVGVGAGMYAGGKVLEGIGEGTIKGMALKGLGKVMQGFDEKLVTTVMGGLATKGISTGTAGAGAALGAGKVLGLNDYDSIAAHLGYMNENPASVVPKLATEMEKAGIPGQVVDAAIPQAIAQQQYLKSLVPVNPFIAQTVSPVPYTPSLLQKATLITATNALHNPLRELANPTPAGMAALRAVYPILVQNAAMIAAQQAARRTDLTLQSRRWASLVTGQPATPLSLPQQQMITAQVSQPQQPPGPSGRSFPVSQPSQLNRLSSN